MEQHQNRKVEIDARDDSFDDVVKMGKDLIARNHYATPEVFIFYLIFCHTTNMMKTKKNRKNRFNNGEETQREVRNYYLHRITLSCI